MKFGLDCGEEVNGLYLSTVQSGESTQAAKLLTGETAKKLRYKSVKATIYCTVTVPITVPPP
jgi:hypothetical protein